MNDRQNSKFNMYQAVSSVCRGRKEVYAKVPAFSEALSELDQRIAEIKELAQQRTTEVVQGFTREKNDAETNMVQSTTKISNCLYALAFTANNKLLLSNVLINKNTLYKASGNDKITIAKSIAAEARRYAADLTAYGIDVADHSELDGAIAAYELLIVKPRTTISEKKQQTGNLAQLFAAADSVIYDRLDKIAGLFKTLSPAFFAEYTNARNVIITGTRKRKPSEAKKE